MGALPPEGERLLAVGAAEFVAERGKLAQELRESGRTDEARAIAWLRKPPAVVLAVNRAARDRPQVARDAAEAARRVGETQLAGDMDAYRTATRDLERSLDLLGEVAVAHVGSHGRPASESMQRRVRELLRSAVTDEDGRAALARGVLAEEREAAGFSSFAGMAVRGGHKRRAGEGRPAARSNVERRAREKALRDDLARAEDALRAAERGVEQAERVRRKAEKAVEAARAKLDRL